jgi:hypothetical protein
MNAFASEQRPAEVDCLERPVASVPGFEETAPRLGSIGKPFVNLIGHPGMWLAAPILPILSNLIVTGLCLRKYGRFQRTYEEQTCERALNTDTHRHCG